MNNSQYSRARFEIYREFCKHVPKLDSQAGYCLHRVLHPVGLNKNYKCVVSNCPMRDRQINLDSKRLQDAKTI